MGRHLRRFRVWFLPEGMGGGSRSSYVMIRKYDRGQGVLAFVHVTMNLGKAEDQDELFTLGFSATTT